MIAFLASAFGLWFFGAPAWAYIILLVFWAGLVPWSRSISEALSILFGWLMVKRFMLLTKSGVCFRAEPLLRVGGSFGRIDENCHCF